MRRINLKLRNRRHHQVCIAGAMVLICGCGSPPSVTPLLRAAGTAVELEVGRLEEDAQRDRLQVESSRRAIRDAFDADLQLNPHPDAAWVRSATHAFALAMEELVRQELRLMQERKQRAENLRDALRAQQRAIRLIEQQDRLIEQTLGFDLWRLDERNWNLAQPSKESRP